MEEKAEIKVDKRKKKQYNVLIEKEKENVEKWGRDKKKIWKYSKVKLWYIKNKWRKRFRWMTR